MVLTVALVAPAMLLAAILFWNVDRQARRAQENQLVETAVALSLAVDREVGQQAALLQALATAPSLLSGDWRAFDAQARKATPAEDVWVVVADEQNRQVLNTRLPLGARPPAPPAGLRSFSWAGPRGPTVRVSNMFEGPVARRPVVIVMQPVRLNDGRVVQLSVGVTASHFDRIFRDQSLPRTWTGSLIDGTASLVARNRDSAKFVGRKASTDMRKSMAAHQTGVVKTRTLEGVTTYSAFSRLPGYGWTVIVGVPRTEMEGAVRGPLIWGLMAGLALLGSGLVAAVRVGESVARPVEALAAAARNSDPGRRVAVPPTGLAEVDDLAAAFAEANRVVDEREAELLESESRFRLVAEDAPVMLWMGDDQGGCLYLNRALREFWGVSEDYSKFSWRDTLLEEDWDGLFSVFGEAMARQEAFEVEARYYRADGAVRTLLTRAIPRREADGRFLGMIGVNVDVTDARRAETHQQLLINELNHRVKNTLATVQSIAHQTLRDGEARELLTARLLALSAAHNVLTRESWEGADLGEVAAEAVRPYEGAEPRITIEGPPVRVGPRTALALSMALHELATNAAKYGALSQASGKVTLRWGLDQLLEIEWRERDGPPVSPPSRRGFGSRLLQGLAAELGASADLAFEPTGVVCVIRARMSEPQDEGEA